VGLIVEGLSSGRRYSANATPGDTANRLTDITESLFTVVVVYL